MAPMSYSIREIGPNSALVLVQDQTNLIMTNLINNSEYLLYKK